MIDLNTVVCTINEKGLRLYRTADSIRVEGDCPPELAEAISTHQGSLLPFVAVAPEVKAKENADCIRQQLEAFALAIVKRYAPRLMDERLAAVVDTQDPEDVVRGIQNKRTRLNGPACCFL